MHRHQLLKFYLITFSCLYLCNISCAPEQSKEERDREVRERSIDRFSKAEGSFLGTLLTFEGNKIPVGLDLSVNRRPVQGGEEPGIIARLRLGILGGIDLMTDQVNYDFGTKLLSASFRGDSGAMATDSAARSMELRAYLDDHLIEDAELVSRSGMKFPLDLQSEPELRLVNPAVELVYPLFIQVGERITVASLNLLRRPGDIAAPSSAELPRLPNLEATLRFAGTSQIAHLADVVHYDPVMDSLDIYFQSGSGMRLAFEQLSTPEDQPLFVRTPQLTGRVEVGGNTIASIQSRPDDSDSIDSVSQSRLPPINYFGTYQNKAGRNLRAVINLTYTGVEGSSGTAQALPRFPQMRLQLSVCLGSRAVLTQKLMLNGIDYLSGALSFIGEGQEPTYFYASQSDSWQSMSGRLVEDTRGGSEGSEARVEVLAQIETERVLNCQDLQLKLSHE